MGLEDDGLEAGLGAARPRAPRARSPGAGGPSRSRTQVSSWGISSSTTTLPPGLRIRAASPSTAAGSLHVVRGSGRARPGPVLPVGSERRCRSSRRKVTLVEALALRRARLRLGERRAALIDGHHRRAQRAMDAESTPVPQPKSATSSGGSSEESAPAQRNQDWPGSSSRSLRAWRSSRARSRSFSRARVSGLVLGLAGELDQRPARVLCVHRQRVVGEAGLRAPRGSARAP